MSEQGYGGFWIRFLALLVDSVIIAIALLAIAFGAIKFLGPLAIPVVGAVYFVGPLLYFIVMHASERQATFGKALLGMVVTDDAGDRLSLPRSIARELAKILSGIPMMLGYVAAAFTQRKQALHDVVASTTVVRHDSGRVALGLLIGVFGWLAPVALVILAGGGLASQLQNMSAGMLQSARGRIAADSTASRDTSVMQAASSTPSNAPAAGAAAAAAAAAPVASRVAEPPPTKTKAAAQVAVTQPTTPRPQPPATVANAPAETSPRPRPRPETRAEPPVVTLDPESAAALDQLSPRFTTEIALQPAWFRDRQVQLYDFGAVPRGAGAARVFWPIHGFDARGNPVAIRGQRPIFTTIPRIGAYSGLWQLVYVVTADMAQPNALRDAAAVDAAVSAKRAMLRDAGLVLNLPIVPRGTTLARDTTRGMLGWYKGREVQFFDFGAATLAPAPMWRFAAARDAARDPLDLEGQFPIVDSLPVAPSYPDVWEIRFVRVDSAYVANTLKSAAAVRSVGLPVDSVTALRNLPVVIVDGAPASRAPSPLRAFADMRSPLPPRPTPVP